MEIHERVLRTDPVGIARAISMVEDGAPGLGELSAHLFPHTGRAATVGMTGSPGVGKSTVAGELVRVARGSGRSVAVLAVDPTSPFTGGALLGDRLRMQEHATDPGVFIRSMATRGHLGGMALAVPEAVRILDAAGYEIVVVETVGVGQAEVDVAAATDTTIVVVSPGWGDAIQVAKAGVMEIADVFVVNKADREGADSAVRDLQQMVGMGNARGWVPPVIRTIAVTGDGIGDLWAALQEHLAHLEASGSLEESRKARLVREVEGMATERLRGMVGTLIQADPGLAQDLLERRTDPYAAAEAVVKRVGGAAADP